MARRVLSARLSFSTRPGFSARRIAGLLVCGLLVATSACAPVYYNHGYVPSDDELSLIEVGKDTRETVGATVGRPAAEGLLNDVGWYYVQSRWRNYGALPPKEEQRQVVAITFSDAGVVENVERFGIERGRFVVLSRRVTDSNIKGIGFLKQLLGNLGRIAPERFLSRGGN